MYELLQRISFSGNSFDFKVAICLVALWVMVVGCTIWSIQSGSRTPVQKKMWIALVVFVPLIGILAYLPTCIDREQVTLLPFFRKQ